MTLNETPAAERVRITFFGVRNAGKSSLVNAVCAQDLSVVSAVAGTTTDIVTKTMELLPIGPVVIVDTPGIDDADEALGALRVEKTHKALNSCDIAVLVVDGTRGLSAADEELLALFKEHNTPYVLAWNKTDLPAAMPPAQDAVSVSAANGEGIEALKERIGGINAAAAAPRPIIADLIGPGDVVVLVIPIDESAPKGRIILPQQLVLRDCLDVHASALCCQPEELAGVLERLSAPPALVITDSQAFARVAQVVPQEVALTSFSLVMARYKGTLSASIAAADALANLHDGQRVLIAEGCTHHRQCNDIGTVKMPAWIRRYTGCEPAFEFCSGQGFPASLEGISLVVHCGGCMLNAKEMQTRSKQAAQAGVPMLNYGMAIAQVNGILKRALAPLRAM